MPDRAGLVALDFEGTLDALQGVLGQRVTVMIAPPGNAADLLLASFRGELHRGQDVGCDDAMAFVVGGSHERGFGQLVLAPGTFTRATLDGDFLGITTRHVEIVIGFGRYTALLEEQ